QPRSVGRLGVRDLAQMSPCDARGRLLRVLLRSALTRAPRLAAQQHGGEEVLRVVGPFVSHLVTGELIERLRGKLLQAGLLLRAPGAGGAPAGPAVRSPRPQPAGRQPP